MVNQIWLSIVGSSLYGSAMTDDCNDDLFQLQCAATGGSPAPGSRWRRWGSLARRHGCDSGGQPRWLSMMVNQLGNEGYLRFTDLHGRLLQPEARCSTSLSGQTSETHPIYHEISVRQLIWFIWQRIECHIYEYWFWIYHVEHLAWKIAKYHFGVKCRIF